MLREWLRSLRSRFAALAPQLPPPPEGLRDLWICVCVVRSQEGPLAEAWPESDSVGYYRNFGARIHPDRIESFLTGLDLDGEIHWGLTEWNDTDPNAYDPDLRKQFTPVDGEGIWYRGGRIFFTEW